MLRISRTCERNGRRHGANRRRGTQQSREENRRRKRCQASRKTNAGSNARSGRVSTEEKPGQGASRNEAGSSVISRQEGVSKKRLEAVEGGNVGQKMCFFGKKTGKKDSGVLHYHVTYYLYVHFTLKAEKRHLEEKFGSASVACAFRAAHQPRMPEKHG